MFICRQDFFVGFYFFSKKENMLILAQLPRRTLTADSN